MTPEIERLLDLAAEAALPEELSALLRLADEAECYLENIVRNAALSLLTKLEPEACDPGAAKEYRE